MLIKKIVSGGQTGVDMAALDVAMELGIDCGGWVPAIAPVYFRAFIFCVVCCFMCFMWGCAESAAPPARPNILFIAIDDLNDWVGVLDGHPNTKTPNIDQLASRGMLFTRAYAQAPLCGPSRASIMSGLRPSTTGIYGQIKDADLEASLPEVTFLPAYLAKYGYKTMGVGKLFHHHAPEGQFEKSAGREPGFGPKPPQRLKWDRKGTSTDWGAFPDADEEMPDYRTAQWAIDRIKEPHNRPFFLAVGFLRPHVPWHVPARWFNQHPKSEVIDPPYLKGDQDDVPDIGRQIAEVPMMPTADWMIEHDEWKAVVQAYQASVSFVDHYVGEVLDALEKSDHAENTIVVLWSDHGYHLGEKNRFAKHSLWEEATHVPLVFAGPEIAAGTVHSTPVELLDLYPTLVDMAGLPPNTVLEGKSLLRHLHQEEGISDAVGITSYGRNNHAVRSERYRYIQYEDGTEELYDHQVDENEWQNLAGDENYQSIKRGLKQYLPEINKKWLPASRYDVNAYFSKQRIEQVQVGG